MFNRPATPKSSFYGTLCQWARRTSTSFADLRAINVQRSEEQDDEDEGDELIYRLTQWPELPCASRTADVLRTLSVMSTRPVNRRWILATTKLRAQDVDHLLRRLVAQDAVQVTDPSRLPRSVPVAAHRTGPVALPRLHLQ